MTDEEYDQLFELVDKLVNEKGTWQEKKKKLLDEGERAPSTWDEFIGWFEE